MNLKKNGKVFTSKSVGTGPSSYEKRIYRATVSQSLRNTDLNEHGKNDEVSWRIKGEGKFVYTVKRRRANWIGHIWRRDCVLKHVIEEG